MRGVQLLTPPRWFTSAPDFTSAEMVCVSPSRAAAISGEIGGPDWQAVTRQANTIIASFMRRSIQEELCVVKYFYRGAISSGIGLAWKSLRHGLAIQRASRLAFFLRALSVEVAVLADSCRQSL